MNFYFILIVSLVVIEFGLETLADVLNYFRLKSGFDANLEVKFQNEFQSLYDPQKYRTALQYQQEGTRFELIKRTLTTGIVMVFFLTGGFNYVDHFARVWDYNAITTGLIFAGVLSLLKILLQLPFSLYSTFVIEQKYGFNKTSLKTFFTDLSKGLLIGMILGAPIFAGIIYFFQESGDSAWLYSWIGVTIFQLVLTYLAPTLIMPLFNRFERLPDGDLKSLIEAYLHSRRFQLSGLFTMDGSKRSTKTNAFFTGFGKFRRLVLFDTLIAKHAPEELVAVVAHEVGHFERKHIVKFTLLSIISSAVLFYAASFFINNQEVFSAFRTENTSIYASLIFIGFAYSPVLRLFSILTQALSRKFEYEADAFSAQTYGKPEALIIALKKLSIDNYSNLMPHPMKVALDYSHPPVLKRIEALRNLAR